MERRIKERFNDSILQEVMQCYGIASDQIHLLDGFESFIYEFERGGGSYILRIAHSLRRSEDLIKGEVDWINYLAAGGASVARAILSDQGRLVEAVDDGKGGSFLVTAFTKAPGRPPWEVGWSPELYMAYGQLLGRMHALSKGYKLANPAWKRLRKLKLPIKSATRKFLTKSIELCTDTSSPHSLPEQAYITRGLCWYVRKKPAVGFISSPMNADSI